MHFGWILWKGGGNEWRLVVPTGSCWLVRTTKGP